MPGSYLQVAFDRETLELVAVKEYKTFEEAVEALDGDDRKVDVVIEAESEESIRARADLGEIARAARRRGDSQDELIKRALAAAIASLPYAERRVLELCDSADGPKLTEAAAEIGCSRRTVRGLRRRVGKPSHRSRGFGL
jgi:DNA-directed RNA polymerase specialized sigma24 family protein